METIKQKCGNEIERMDEDNIGTIFYCGEDGNLCKDCQAAE